MRRLEPLMVGAVIILAMAGSARAAGEDSAAICAVIQARVALASEVAVIQNRITNEAASKVLTRENVNDPKRMDAATEEHEFQETKLRGVLEQLETYLVIRRELGCGRSK